MAKVFLDTNFVIDIAYRKPEIRKLLDGQETYISPLAIHILCYVNSIKIPNKELIRFKKEYEIVDLSDNLLEKAILGPTDDFEDNVQLHSAAEAECDYFLTNDKNLLKMKFFGKTKIADSLNQ